MVNARCGFSARSKHLFQLEVGQSVNGTGLDGRINKFPVEDSKDPCVDKNHLASFKRGFLCKKR